MSARRMWERAICALSIAVGLCSSVANVIWYATHGATRGELMLLSAFCAPLLLAFFVFAYQTGVEAQRRLDQWRRERGQPDGT